MRRTIRPRLRALALAGGLILPATARAVEVPTDYASLRDALDNTTSGGAITVLSTYDLSEDETCLTLDRDVSILGAGTPRLPGLKIQVGAVSLEGVRVSGECQSNITLPDTGDQSAKVRLFVAGGALTGRELTLDPSSGVGLMVRDATATVESLTASGFTALPAVYGQSLNAVTQLTLTHPTFAGNQGTAIALVDFTQDANTLSLSVQNGTFTGNNGALAADILSRLGEVEVRGSTFVGLGYTPESDVVLPIEAASISLVDAPLLVSDTAFSDCSSAGGGAISVLNYERQPVSLERVDISRCAANRERGYGGLLATNGAVVTLRDISADAVAAYGGALLSVFNGGSLDAERVEVVNFEVTERGAVNINDVPSARLGNARFCGGVSSSPYYGVAIYSVNAADVDVFNSVFHALQSPSNTAITAESTTLTLRNNTFAGNTVYGMLGLRDSEITAYNNIFAHAPGGRAVVGAGEVTVARNGYNLFYGLYAMTESIAGFTNPSSDLVDVEPGFVGDWNDQDCTSLPLLAQGSAAIDGGDPSVLDLDGTRSDIGAYGGPDAAVDGSDTGGDSGDDSADSEDAGSAPRALRGGCGGCDGSGGLVLGMALVLRRRRIP